MDIDTLRRIAERGLKKAQQVGDDAFIDTFQHLLDEIARIQPGPQPQPGAQARAFTRIERIGRWYYGRSG